MTDPFDPAPGPGPAEAPGAATAVHSRGPGQRLRQARLRRGMEVRQVARELRLTVDRVLAIEEDDYAALPDPVFVVGYVKSYARLLELNPEALAHAYRSSQARSPVPPKPNSPPPPRIGNPAATPIPGTPTKRSRPGLRPVRWPGFAAGQGSGNGRSRGEEGAEVLVGGEGKREGEGKGGGRRREINWAAVTATLLLALLILAWWWVQKPADNLAPSLAGQEQPAAEVLGPSLLSANGASPRATPAEAPPMTSRPETTQASGLAIRTQEESAQDYPEEVVLEPLEEDGEGEQEAQGNTFRGETPTDNSMIAATSFPREADVAQVEEKLAVMIRFIGPTSVDIRDSTMNYALVGEMDKGDHYLFGGKPPYSLIIGNAAAVELEVGGKPFDFQSVVRGNVARFILDPAPVTSAP
ncbi:MAG: helix-turn-helix domain-containing protein [Gammaproteobacteria bacterium]|nr:helix-turn-helix domain-containing protein [Candidatus Thioaporhodococcus sediminis]TNF55230.1 MAG: helix-turn-helix domain-containing protein [Gammaproteobacteria bacterium]